LRPEPYFRISRSGHNVVPNRLSGFDIHVLFECEFSFSAIGICQAISR
jgi:hypothetical protein